MVTISKEEQNSPNILEKLRSKEYCTQQSVLYTNFFQKTSFDKFMALYSVMANRYAVSKLLNVLFTRALNARVPPSTSLIVNTANPGFCATTLRRSFTFPLNILDWILVKLLANTSEVGSRQLVYAAIGGTEDEAKIRGAFISTSEIREVSDFVLSEEGAKVQDRIWVSCSMCLVA